jgi:putative polyketide hydroxylase
MENHQVLVVGAGPAGLTAAAALAHCGIDVLVVEKRLDGSPLPRATVLSLRTMELLRSWGLDERILAGADDVEMTMLEMPSVARAAEGTSIDVGYPTQAHSQVLSPTAAACAAQDHLEAVLLQHVSSLATATVERGVEVVDLAHHGGATTVTMRDASGRDRTVTADYVIGADGAKSAVRASMGVELVGMDNLLNGLLVEFRAPLWDVLGDHRHLIYWISNPDAMGTLIPAGRGDRWLFGPLLGDHASTPDLPSDAALRSYLRRSFELPDLEVSIDRVGWFSSGAQLAERFARGNVFLVGDAAHRVTPRGGTGLNIAIADGFHLGWKLAWVLLGWAPDSLLATYEAERRPAVTYNVERSADPNGSRRDALTEVHFDLGGRIRHAWIDPPLRSTLDALGDGLTLFVAADHSGWLGAAASAALSVPISVVSLGTTASRSLGVGHDGGLLVRPDGFPVAQWQSSADAPAQLHRAVSTFLHGPAPDALQSRSAA